jgi:hypothetical protein
VNSLLKTLNTYNHNQLDVGFEFLKFSQLCNEALSNNNNFLGLDVIDCSFGEKENLQGENKEVVKIEESYDHKTRKISISDHSNSDSTSQDEKVKQDSFCITTFIPPENISINEVYCFGGIVVQEDNKIDDSLVSFSVGTTANIIFLKDKYCYVANVGDSLVLFRNGKAIKLNTEHKPSIPKEKERILNSGSEIVNNRISGRLNLTRALGDFKHKNKDTVEISHDKQAVISVPEN